MKTIHAKLLVSLMLGFMVLFSVVGIASAHTVSHAAPVTLDKHCPKYHLTAALKKVRDQVTRATFDTVTGCGLNRNDLYDVFTSDDCITVLVDGQADVVQADGEGRINFEVRFGGSQQKPGCDPDLYIITLRDEANNHQKAHVGITILSA